MLLSNWTIVEKIILVSIFSKSSLSGFRASVVKISSSVNLGTTTGATNFTELRDSINAYTAQTGVEAVLSPDFSYVYLTNSEGYDIKIADLDFDLETSTSLSLATTCDADSAAGQTKCCFYDWSERRRLGDRSWN